MSTRNLDFLFKPKSVVIIGASKKPLSVGCALVNNLVDSQFSGEVFLINPAYADDPNYLSSIEELPKAPELAVIAAPADVIPELLQALGLLGTKAVSIITTGESEGLSAQNQAFHDRILELAEPFLMRVIGPNCLGVISPSHHMNASFSHIQPTAGDIAFIAQSGSILTSVADWATQHEIGFSHLVSMGDMIDVDIGDCIDYLANDDKTRAILIYLETINDARKFMSAARAASRGKPVLVVKGGRYLPSAVAASHHTGSLASPDKIYDAAFRRAGMLRVYSMSELFDAVETLSKTKPFKGNRIAVVTNGGGIGVMVTDDIIAQSGKLATLSEATIEQLGLLLGDSWRRGNPVDVISDPDGERYGQAINILLDAREVDVVLAMNSPTAINSSRNAAEVVVKQLKRRPRAHVFTCWMGETYMGEVRHLFAKHGIPSYDTPGQAVRAMMHMIHYQENQEQLTQTPSSSSKQFRPDKARVAQVIEQAVSEGRQWLTLIETYAVLEAYTIPVNQHQIASDAREAANLADDMGYPVVMKVLSKQVVLKNRVGGVVLNVSSFKHALESAESLISAVESAVPGVEVDGIIVEPMIYRENSHDLIVGVAEDLQFGPIIIYGQGSASVNVVGDTAIALPPLNGHLAEDLMSRPRVDRLLRGYRQHPAANRDEVKRILIATSQLSIDFPQIQDININPLRVDSQRVIALGARIKLDLLYSSDNQRLAIKPYPKELEQLLDLPTGQQLLLRPIRPEDEPALQAGFNGLTEEEVRLRFFHNMKQLGHAMAARLTQIDYDRNMALVLVDPDRSKQDIIFADVRILADPNNERAEYAILLHHDMAGKKIGQLLMRIIIQYARERGLKEIYGDVLAENIGMLKVCKKLGFKQSFSREYPGVVRVLLNLEDAE